MKFYCTQDLVYLGEFVIFSRECLFKQNLLSIIVIIENLSMSALDNLGTRIKVWYVS